MEERELIIRKNNMKNYQSRWKLRFKKKLLSLIQQGKDVVIDFSFWSKENRNVYKELIQKAGAETELLSTPSGECLDQHFRWRLMTIS